MKHLKKILLAFLIAGAGLTGCGVDGIDGDVYLAITNEDNVTSYWDNNNGIPYGFYYGMDYGPCSPGTYNYQYTFESYPYYGTWTGTYSISRNYATDGSFLKDGEDGADKHYVLHLRNGGAMTVSRPGSAVEENLIILPSDTSSFSRTFDAGDLIIKIEGRFQQTEMAVIDRNKNKAH